MLLGITAHEKEETVMYRCPETQRRDSGLDAQPDSGYLKKAVLWISTTTYPRTQRPSIYLSFAEAK